MLFLFLSSAEKCVSGQWAVGANLPADPHPTAFFTSIAIFKSSTSCLFLPDDAYDFMIRDHAIP